LGQRSVEPSGGAGGPGPGPGPGPARPAFTTTTAPIRLGSGPSGYTSEPKTLDGKFHPTLSMKNTGLAKGLPERRLCVFETDVFIIVPSKEMYHHGDLTMQYQLCEAHTNPVDDGRWHNVEFNTWMPRQWAFTLPSGIMLVRIRAIDTTNNLATFKLEFWEVNVTGYLSEERVPRGGAFLRDNEKLPVPTLSTLKKGRFVMQPEGEICMFAADILVVKPGNSSRHAECTPGGSVTQYNILIYAGTAGDSGTAGDFTPGWRTVDDVTIVGADGTSTTVKGFKLPRGRSTVSVREIDTISGLFSNASAGVTVLVMGKCLLSDFSLRTRTN